MSDIKRDYYGGPPAADFLSATDPFALFDTWFADAALHEINDPNGMALSTVDPDGMPNVRMVLLKGLDPATTGPERGFVFYTNIESAKGRELLAAKKAAFVFHWKSLRRQVRVRGNVSVVNDAEADAYFATRARGSRLGAWASQQSRPLQSRYALEKAVAAMTLKYPMGDIPRPPYWSGLRITPVEIEFWHDRPFRLHDRVVFRRASPDAPWTSSALYP
jgi:pyridoxamine 5'-phosphate oxidase